MKKLGSILTFKHPFLNSTSLSCEQTLAPAIFTKSWGRQNQIRARRLIQMKIDIMQSVIFRHLSGKIRKGVGEGFRLVPWVGSFSKEISFKQTDVGMKFS